MDLKIPVASSMYVIDADGQTRRALTMQEWGRCFANMKLRRVDRTRVSCKLNCGQHTVEVSTVFLGMNHRFMESGPPILFETMVFDCVNGGAIEDWTKRYCYFYQAKQGHAKVVKKIRSFLGKAHGKQT